MHFKDDKNLLLALTPILLKDRNKDYKMYISSWNNIAVRINHIFSVLSCDLLLTGLAACRLGANIVSVVRTLVVPVVDSLLVVLVVLPRHPPLQVGHLHPSPPLHIPDLPPVQTKSYCDDDH